MVGNGLGYCTHCNLKGEGNEVLIGGFRLKKTRKTKEAVLQAIAVPVHDLRPNLVPGQAVTLQATVKWQ